MKIYNSLISAIFIIFLSLTGITYAETLNFGSSTYEGEVKKGRAHGVGIFTFKDGSRQAVLVVYTIKDGKITRSETGATNLD